jgi:hypothetical protein
MQVLVRGVREVVVDDDVDSLDVDASSEQICRHQDAFIEIFERFVASDSLFLLHA